MPALDATSDLVTVLEAWEKDQSTAAAQQPVQTLNRLAEIVEKETEAYLKMDPDPFDDRHPIVNSRSLGLQLVKSYVVSARDNAALSTAACRLMLDILPGLEVSVIFQETEGLVNRLFQWAEFAAEPLRAYATGLLAAAMELQDVATNFRDQNAHLVPIMLRRLHGLKHSNEKNAAQTSRSPGKDGGGQRPFSHLNASATPQAASVTVPAADIKEVTAAATADGYHRRGDDSLNGDDPARDPAHDPAADAPTNHPADHATISPGGAGNALNHRAEHTMSPPGGADSLRNLGDLTSHEAEQLLSFVFEHRAIDLVLHYIDLSKNNDVRLAFEALKYLASLLCHKKFSLEFINAGGVQVMLQVYRPSFAATGVSLCLYYLAFCEDAMEKVCLLPEHTLKDLVSYGLWLLECSHESGRCHATMFFGAAFAFPIVLELFDIQDGLRKLINVMSTLQVLNTEERLLLTDDEMFASRQTIRHVANALRRYLEAHLVKKVEQVKRSSLRQQGVAMLASVPPYKVVQVSAEQVRSSPSVCWRTSESLVSIFGALSICAVMPKVQLQLCESLTIPGEEAPHRRAIAIGFSSFYLNTDWLDLELTVNHDSILISVAEGDPTLLVTDPDVQRAALGVIIVCVCGPQSRLGGSIGRFTGGAVKRRAAVRNGEDILSKMWKAVRATNGIMVLISLMMVKTPITDADSIRALAIKALAGLARSDIVKQIISKLPLFSSGQLQALMKEPVLHDKRPQHLRFCEHARQLIERVTGKPMMPSERRRPAC
ncbi:PREDICTED: protein VPRBP-like [Priapulus caudatus]|uniref:Protein VPRBP-like n=1 Tax=Priapulus caudatus TaxID=37621 RepID=A0ABM1EKF9_PRICU|nr:PREDICTED: protein VPRBP-like [Priapulus caudatus]